MQRSRIPFFAVSALAGAVFLSLGDVASISLTPTPVIVKTPILPLTIFPVAPNELGQWYTHQM